MKFTKVDDSIRDLHFFLGPDDECYFMREYASHAGYQHSETNSIISNLKKDVSRRNKPEWQYKERDIARAGRELREGFNIRALGGWTIVPIPPSAAKSDPAYDDRLLRILRAMAGKDSLDIRELVLQQESMTPSHATTTRPRISDLTDNYEIDEAKTNPAPAKILVMDDVLTTGRHFVAMKQVLQARFGAIEVRGFFYARRIIPEGVATPDDDT